MKSSGIRRTLFRLALLATFAIGLTCSAQAQKRYRVGYKDAGFSFISEAAVILPSNTYDLAFNFNAIFGGYLNANMYIGAGIALDAYESDLFATGFADFRYMFIADQFSPYFFLDAGYGYGVDIDPILSGGPMLNPGAGIKYYMSNTTALNLALGYRFQSMPIDNDLPEASTSTRTNWITGLAIRVGLQF